jgi:hypothetical protein
MQAKEHRDPTAREIERTIAIDECVSVCNAIRDYNPKRAEPFARALIAAVTAGARIMTFRAITAEARQANREEVSR